jgi:hypothetical protein
VGIAHLFLSPEPNNDSTRPRRFPFRTEARGVIRGFIGKISKEVGGAHPTLLNHAAFEEVTQVLPDKIAAAADIFG